MDEQAAITNQLPADRPAWYRIIAAIAGLALPLDALCLAFVWLLGPAAITDERKSLCLVVLAITLIALILGFVAHRKGKYRVAVTMLLLGLTLTIGWIVLFVDTYLYFVNNFEKYDGTLD